VSDLPALRIDIPSALAKAVETITQLAAVIESLKAPAALGQAVMDDGECYGFATAAKMLSPKLEELTGHDIGRDRLIDVLKALRIIDDGREPYQQFAHHFKVVPKQTPVGIKTTSLLTGKGLAWVLPKLVEYYR
jgi:hypothetical protein